ncbi:hypothetical protein R1flu_026610 [Riccia fluitans]|uniref:BTB domain-containing protein n=1 Tax=Riccia fluitans TaxID=41844 RepID=A0ABD1XGF5_9MARC
MNAWSYENGKERVDEESSKRAEDLRAMVNNITFSDVTFNCKDGVKIYASRMFLAARSPLLRALLLNGMVESKVDIIPLPTIASSIFIEVLRFLYAGGASFHVNMRSTFLSHSWIHIVDLIVALRFFLLERLEVLVVRRLWHDVPPGNISYSVDMLNDNA